MNQIYYKKIINAYTNAVYTFQYKNDVIKLEINKKNSRVDSILKENGCSSYAFITAYNPFSNPLSNMENAHRNQSLHHDLIKSGYTIYDGSGNSIDQTWQEPSFFVSGISLQKAMVLGQNYQQMAILYGEMNSITKLVFLFEPLELKDGIVTDKFGQSQRLNEELLKSSYTHGNQVFVPIESYSSIFTFVNKLFVYGTLRVGEAANYKLSKCNLLQKDSYITGYQLYVKGDFPIAVKSKFPNSTIRGDLYLVDDATLEELDHYENVGKGEFIREFNYDHILHLYIKGEATDVKSLVLIPSGNWKDYQKK